MSQSSIIFAEVLLAFLIYITMKGELSKYLGFFIPPSNKTTASKAATGTTTAGSGTDITSILPLATPLKDAAAGIGMM